MPTFNKSVKREGITALSFMFIISLVATLSSILYAINVAYAGVGEFTTVSVDDSNPPWDRVIIANGTLFSFSFVNCVVVDWGDDSPNSVVSGSDVTFDSESGFGAWSGANHAYSNPGSYTITATEGQIDVDFPHNCNTFGSPGSTVVNVRRHDTTLILNPMSNPVIASNLTGSGTLIDADTGSQVEGQSISFGGSGGTGVLPNVTTEGVTFIDPTNIQIDSCAVCIPDIVGAESNNVMLLHAGAQIFFPSGTNVVIMTLQDMDSERFVAEVTDSIGSTFTVDSYGASPDAVDSFITGPHGVKSIKITSITDSDGVPLSSSATIGISKIRTQDPASNPIEKLTLDFEDLLPDVEVGSDSKDITASAIGPTVTQSGGTFFSTGTVTAPPTSGLAVQAHYAGNSLYNASDSNVQLYDILSDTWGGLGEPGSVTITADSGTGINTIICAADQDGDGLCDNWELLRAIPYSGGSFSLCITDAVTGTLECPNYQHKDIFVEIDYMQGHRPLIQALRDVKTAFANAPVTNPNGINGINLHIQLDEQLPYVASLNVWKASSNDFFGIKQAKFGTAADHGATLLASNPKLRDGKAQAFHYALFANSIGTCGPSGIAELPGNDLIVSLGCGFHGAPDGFGGTQGTLEEQKGTLMHELGHNLNLNHGGPMEYRTLPAGYRLDGTQTNQVIDGATGDTSRTFKIFGMRLLTPGLSSGTVVMTAKLPFSLDPGTVSIGSITRTEGGLGVIVNTITPSISGTGLSRLVTLKVTFSTIGATDATNGNLGTFTIPLSVTITSAELQTSIITPGYSPTLKINISSSQSGPNCKPNYPSVMTYVGQTNAYLGADWILDYSRKTLATINEGTSLTESNFFSPDTGSRLVHAYQSGLGRAYRTDATPSMDWDGSGLVTGASIQDPNYFGINDCQASPGQSLRGFEDWHNIQYNFRESLAQIDGVYPNPHLVREMNGVIGDQIGGQVAENTANTTASPPGATYDKPQTITLSTKKPATIYYTTDGTNPTRSSAHGGSPVTILISSNTVLKFFSVNSQDNAEVIRVESYTIGQTPVGGNILSTDTSVLLVAGAFTNAYWLLPAVGLAGALLFAMRTAVMHKRKKGQNENNQVEK